MAIPTYVLAILHSMSKYLLILSLFSSYPIGAQPVSISLPTIKTMVKIGTGIHAVTDGETTRFMTENGRFVLEGQIYDLWQQRLLTEFQEIERAVKTIDMRKLDFDLTALAPIQLGTGPLDVVLFIDPQCSYCHQLLKNATELITEYTFWVMPIAILGEQSMQAVKSLSCEHEPQEAIRQLIEKDIANQKAGCDVASALGAIQKRMITAQVFGIQAVPFMIAPDGRTKQGMPSVLVDWLRGGDE